ncbi:hypothetical protein DVB69_01270 [Sporosarcina sp. BI001-red]|uniref:ParM/StbA family protein n=1 Tax=Sporosarcina sp. BI001-red TaxID=2282866 RepID=UPI000E251271|nr:ParM/StbA family protein [Sporosarcina sp. BI001-red]REB11155.1 hypothetical protein DVB69_01270 [Sporosarcina sp. BI001-red]
MKEQIFISIDSGKHTTKAILQGVDIFKTVQFRTKIQEVSDIGIDIPLDSYKVDYESKQYLVGSIVPETQSDFNLSKESYIHKIAIYTAITELMRMANLRFYDKSIRIAVNVPIHVYKKQALKNSFKKFIENNNLPIQFCLNDMQYNFHLSEVTICFEGMGLTYANHEEQKNATSVVLDIGGLNTTYCTFVGVQPNFNSMNVSHLGINTLKTDLECELVEKYNCNISSDDLEHIIQKGYFSNMGKVEEESKEIIQNIKKKHFDKIINYAKQHNYTFNQDHIYFVGGGSLILKEQIQINLPEASIVVNPQYANVKSFMEILKVKYL